MTSTPVLAATAGAGADPLAEVLAVEPMQAALGVGGLAVLSAAMAAGVAAAYRWYARGTVPRGLAVLVGLAAVAVVLNTTAALGQVLGGEDDPLSLSVAAFNLTAFLVAAAAAPVGRRLGDRLGRDGFALVGGRELDADVGQLVRAVGRVVTVELPVDVADVDGYDPVAEDVKAQLAGKRLVFPRGLTVAELRDRLATRLAHDYDVGHVDVELAVDGTVEYLALGRRRAGLGPTLAPGTAAVAVVADPPFSARAGDRVQLRERGADPARVATAELRAAVDDTATLAVDADDAADLAAGEFRLVTLPAETRPDRDLAGLLRAADETLAAVAVRPGSALDGAPVGSLDATVVAVRPDGGRVEAIPGRERVLTAGDELFVVARPEAIRKVEGAAAAAESAAD